MTKKFLQQLVLASYTNDQLDQITVNKIASFLHRGELKDYIRALKTNERKRSVVITSVLPLNREEEEKMKQVYPDKKIIILSDPSLLLGLRIQDNDTIYQLNLRDSLERIREYVEE
ncbi:MAG: hypothetical protein HY431_03090 [Candidatus Levybacteria bacterium]|nr:hypothetical protein [Candidatus Levybacteria bacterium]